MRSAVTGVDGGGGGGPGKKKGRWPEGL